MSDDLIEKILDRITLIIISAMRLFTIAWIANAFFGKIETVLEIAIYVSYVVALLIAYTITKFYMEREK